MNKRNLKIAWVSNPTFTPSGYSQQTYDMERQFIKAGWDSTNFALINMFGHQGSKFKDELGIWNYPLINHPTGSDAMVFHGQHFKADIVIGLFDIHTQDPQMLAQIPRFIPWVPIDYNPMPPGIANNLRYANRIIAMSKFGQKTMQEMGFSSTYIPHHVDTNIFKPLDKKKAKTEMNIDPNFFVFGMVAENKNLFPRKSFGEVLEAFAKFVKKHQQTILYIHTDPDFLGGYPIRHHAKILGIEHHLRFPEPYKWRFDFSKEDMNRIFNAFDVCLMPSSTEGFGITAIEAQAAGVPVIVNDYTSMPELIRNEITGYITKVGCSHMAGVGSFMRFPDTEDLYQKMLRIKGMKLEVMGKEARKWIEQNYAMDVIWENNWIPFLNRLEQEIYPKPLTTSVSTA